MAWQQCLFVQSIPWDTTNPESSSKAAPGASFLTEAATRVMVNHKRLQILSCIVVAHVGQPVACRLMKEVSCSSELHRNWIRAKLIDVMRSQLLWEVHQDQTTHPSCVIHQSKFFAKNFPSASLSLSPSSSPSASPSASPSVNPSSSPGASPFW